MSYENQNLTSSQKMKRFGIGILDMICKCITGNDDSEIPCNLNFLEIPADFSERKLTGERWKSQKLTWLPYFEIMAISTGIVVAMILATI